MDKKLAHDDPYEFIRSEMIKRMDKEFFGPSLFEQTLFPQIVRSPRRSSISLDWKKFRGSMDDMGVDVAPMPQVITSYSLTMRVLIRMCKSKKKRIRKKWLKNPSNYKTVPFDGAYLINGVGMVCHPSVAAKIKASTDTAHIWE